ncbi:MAG: DUF1428 domain-containing protein [Pikeienuella sp.]
MYVDGFLVAVPFAKKAEYAVVAARAAEIFKSHGALRVVECWGDDMPDGPVSSFASALKLEHGEVAVFSWIEYPDKETREACNAAFMADPRTEQDMSIMPFDSNRIIFGGFSALLDQ